LRRSGGDIGRECPEPLSFPEWTRKRHLGRCSIGCIGPQLLELGPTQGGIAQTPVGNSHAGFMRTCLGVVHIQRGSFTDRAAHSWRQRPSRNSCTGPLFAATLAFRRRSFSQPFTDELSSIAAFQAVSLFHMPHTVVTWSRATLRRAFRDDSPALSHLAYRSANTFSF
jgi:hypothetical protein